MSISPDCASFEIKLHHLWDCIVCRNSDREKEWKPKEALVDFAAKQVDGRWALVVSNSLFAYLFLPDFIIAKKIALTNVYILWVVLKDCSHPVHPCVMCFVP